MSDDNDLTEQERRELQEFKANLHDRLTKTILRIAERWGASEEELRELSLERTRTDGTKN